MSPSDWIALVAAIAATGATVFAAVELRNIWLERRGTRTAYRNGVAVTWRPLERPNSRRGLVVGRGVRVTS